MIRIVVVDDLKISVDVLKSSIQKIPDLSVIGIASNGRDAIKVVEKHNPHVVLMDMSMPIMDGISATKIITRRFADTKVIVITGFDDRRSRILAIKAGANGYLSKLADVSTINLAISHVAAGYDFFSF